MILYRPMVEGDIPAGLSLCRAAGWNQTAEDWKLFLELSPHGCRVAVDESGQVRGTVATVRYQDRFGWVGMVLVDPQWQRRGIGIQLLREALNILSVEDTVKLDATPAGRKIYVQLNFTDEHPLSRMEAREILPTGLRSSARLVQKTDLPSLLELDRRVFGADRSSVLKSILKRGRKYAFFCGQNREVKGYCFGRSGHNFVHLGPVVSPDIDAAKEVVSAALRNCSGTPVIMDIFHHSTEWIEWLTSLGFKQQRSLTRMFRGTNTYPGIPSQQFAVLGPELG